MHYNRSILQSLINYTTPGHELTNLRILFNVLCNLKNTKKTGGSKHGHAQGVHEVGGNHSEFQYGTNDHETIESVE